MIPLLICDKNILKLKVLCAFYPVIHENKSAKLSEPHEKLIATEGFVSNTKE